MKTKRRKIGIMFALMLVVVVSVSTVFATDSILDTTKTGTLTIIAYEQNNGSNSTNVPISGVEYTLYKVGDVIESTSTVNGTTTTVTQIDQTVNSVTDAESYIVGKTAVGTQTTGEDGKAYFSGLELGRYYAKVTNYPDGVSQTPQSFLVDIPTTDEDGTGWDYDVEAYPKIQTVTQGITITKTDEDKVPLNGIKFKVQVSTDDGSTWEDYIPAGETGVLTLTTQGTETSGEAKGEIVLENLPTTYNMKSASFRLIETSTLTGYIIDNKNPNVVKVTTEGKVLVNGVEDEDNAFSITNAKPTLTKEVEKDDGTYSDVASISKTEKASFKITVDVPSIIADLKTYTVTDTLPSGLTGRENLVITGVTSSGSETISTDAYTKTEEGQVLTLTFVPEKLTSYTQIIITYEVSLDMDNAVIGSTGNTNTATLTYTNEVDVDGEEKSTTTTTDTSKVVTGAIKIYKVDGDSNPLAGAKFKVATDEDGTEFVKDENGDDLVVTSGSDGYVTISGLAYEDDETARTYYLVEIETPTYTDDNGETKHYNLITKPIAFSIDGESQNSEIKVINKKQILLPLTGGIGVVLFAVLGVALFFIAKNMKKAKAQVEQK